MASTCFYFQVHQPHRIKRYRVFDVGHDHRYFNSDSDDNTNNDRVLQKVARTSYLPANELILGILKKHPELDRKSVV